MKLTTKILVSSVIIGGLFVGGNVLTQSILEVKAVDGVIETSQKGNETINDVERYLAERGEKNVAHYFETERYFDKGVLKDFEKQFGHDTKNMLVKELTKEEEDYLEGLGAFYQYKDLPILTKNQVKVKGEDRYSGSLEANIADAMAMSSGDDSEGPIIAICRKYHIDPNGIVATLPIEAIVEINEALYKASSHPKD